MRFLPLLLLCLLFSCSDNSTPAPAATSSTPDAPAVIPFDREMGDDPAINAIKTAYARIEDLYQSNGLDRKRLSFDCGDLMGRFEILKENGEVVLALGEYKDGTQRTVTDRWYFRNGELFFQLSENNTWLLDGPMRTDSNGNSIPGVKNTTYQYRYYISEGKVYKSLKKTWENYSYRTDNVNPAEVPHEEMEPLDRLPFQYTFAKSVIAADSVNCDFLTKVE